MLEAATANPPADSDEEVAAKPADRKSSRAPAGTGPATRGKASAEKAASVGHENAPAAEAPPTDAVAEESTSEASESQARRKAYGRAIGRARRLSREEPENVDGVLALLREAAAHVEPGPERAVALTQAAALQLRSGHAEGAVDTLLTAEDWPHHTAPALRTLERAAVRAEAPTPIEWLATRPTASREPTLAAVDHAVRAALREGSVEFAGSLVALAVRLAQPGDPLPALLGGLVLDKEKRHEEAIAAFSKAASLGSIDGRCHTRLVSLLAKAGHKEEASAFAQRALELDPALEAPARQQLEKAIIRLEGAPAGTRRAALAKLLPLYVRIGEAGVERLARFPAAPATACQAGSLVVGLGSRAGARCVFLRDPRGELALDIELTFPAGRVIAPPDGGHCLAIETRDEDSVQAMAITVGGPTAQGTLPALPHRVLALADHCILTYRHGGVESRAWTGEPRWSARLGKHGFAYWIAGDGERLVASYLDGVYEIDPAQGDMTGPMTIYDEPSRGVRGPAEAAEYKSAWVHGLGAIDGKIFALVRGGFYEVLPGPRLLLRERISPEEPVDQMLSDEDGRLTALQCRGCLRIVGHDGRLSAAFASPVEGRGIARLGADRVAVHGGRVLSVLGPAGETHRLEAATPIRSVRAIDKSTLCVVAGRDVLAVTLG